MTVLDHRPRTTWTPRLPHRHEIVTTGGMVGVLDIGAALRLCGYPVQDFTVDVRDGVPYSSITCTVSLSADEIALFAERMGAVPSVLSVEPC